MQTIIAAGLIALAGQATPAGTAVPAEPVREVSGKALKDTPDDALRTALADPSTPDGVRSGILREIALRDEWRRNPGRLTDRNGLYRWEPR